MMLVILTGLVLILIVSVVAVTYLRVDASHRAAAVAAKSSPAPTAKPTFKFGRPRGWQELGIDYYREWGFKFAVPEWDSENWTKRVLRDGVTEYRRAQDDGCITVWVETDGWCHANVQRAIETWHAVQPDTVIGI